MQFTNRLLNGCIDIHLLSVLTEIKFFGIGIKGQQNHNNSRMFSSSLEKFVDEISEQRKDINHLDTRVTATEDNVDNLSKEVDQNKTDIKKVNKDVKKQGKQIDELKVVVDETVEKVDEIDHKVRKSDVTTLIPSKKN